MKFTIVCQHCGSKLSIKSTLIGKKFRCPKCSELIRLQSPDTLPQRKSTVRSPQNHLSDETEIWDVNSDASVLSGEDHVAQSSVPIQRNHSAVATASSSNEVTSINLKRHRFRRQQVVIGIMGIILGVCFGYCSAPGHASRVSITSPSRTFQTSDNRQLTDSHQPNDGETPADDAEAEIQQTDESQTTDAAEPPSTNDSPQAN